jgi:DNA modification methylase
MIEAKIDDAQLPINQILCGDCVEVMKTLHDESFDLTMFSPPYWGLRDYGVKGQIGLEEHPIKYIQKMVEVCKQVKRLLKKTGSMYLVMGDTYWGGGQGRGYGGKNDWKPELGNFYPSIAHGKKSNWLQPKQLLGIPWHVAIALQEDSWILRNDIIWYKPNHMPSSVTDRLTNAYEHIFHFVKSRKYYYDLGAIRERPISIRPSGNKERKPCLQPRDTHVGRSIPWSPYKGKFEGLREKAEAFGSPRARNERAIIKQGMHHGSSLTKGRACHYEGQHIEGSANGKNPADFVNITTQPFKGAHFAVYPEQVCIRPIKSSCPSSGIVLDPMCGSGTTLAVAKKLGRKYLGIELNPKYIAIAVKRLNSIPEKITTFF